MWLSRGHSGRGSAHWRPFQVVPSSQQSPPGITRSVGHCSGSSSGRQRLAGMAAAAEAGYCTPWSLCSTSAEIAALTVLTTLHCAAIATSVGMKMVIFISVYLPTGMVLKVDEQWTSFSSVGTQLQFSLETKLVPSGRSS